MYYVVVIPPSLYVEKEQKVLDDAGEFGWELVSVIIRPCGHIHHYFKRPA